MSCKQKGGATPVSHVVEAVRQVMVEAAAQHPNMTVTGRSGLATTSPSLALYAPTHCCCVLPNNHSQGHAESCSNPFPLPFPNLQSSYPALTPVGSKPRTTQAHQAQAPVHAAHRAQVRAKASHQLTPPTSWDR